MCLINLTKSVGCVGVSVGCEILDWLFYPVSVINSPTFPPRLKGGGWAFFLQFFSVNQLTVCSVVTYKIGYLILSL